MVIPISTSHSCRSFFLLSALFFCSFVIQPSSANTQYSSEKGSCQILGDPDVYGIGVRLSLYLQWASLLVSILIAPEAASVTRTTSNIVTISVIINTFRGATTKDSLIVVEWYIVIFLTFSLSYFNLPTSLKQLKKDLGSMMVTNLLYALILVTPCVLYFKFLYYGAKPGCKPQIFLIIAHFSAYSRGWVIVSKVAGVFGAVTGFCTAVGALQFFRLALKEWDDEETPLGWEFLNWGSEKLRTRIVVGLLVAFGSVSIACAEMTIKVNRITFPGSTILDSGQLVPLLIGIFDVAVAAWEYLRWVYRHTAT